MVTLNDIINCTRFPIRLEHTTLTNRDGTPLRARSNGMVKVWKTRPGEFQLPAKYGLKQCFYITERNADEWVIVSG
jgi:hypothetical protein